MLLKKPKQEKGKKKKAAQIAPVKQKTGRGDSDYEQDEGEDEVGNRMMVHLSQLTENSALTGEHHSIEDAKIQRDSCAA